MSVSDSHEPCAADCGRPVMTDDSDRCVCDDFGEWWHRGCWDEHQQNEAERAFERQQEQLMSDPPESYESIHAKERLLK